MDAKRQPKSIVLVLAGLVAAGALASFAGAGNSPGSGSGKGLRAFDVTLTPNYISRDDARSNNYQVVWLYPKSPTTPYRSPDSYAHQGRYLLVDPRATDADGRPGRDDWWFIIQRYWPASYQPSTHGSWGGEVNFHNVAGDAGPGSGIGWGFGTGVSSLSLSWLPGQSSPEFTVEPNHPHENLPLPPVTRDTWHTYVVHFIAGRTDGSTVRPGALTVWADGGDKPVIDLHDINTVQRALGPDGKWYVQRWMQLWEGDYTQGLQAVSTVRLALTRIGATLPQAIADRPTLAGTNLYSQYYSGSGVNVGPPSVHSAGSLAAAASAIPAGLLAAARPVAPTAATRKPALRNSSN